MSAIFGLAGVLIGATLTLGYQELQHRRTETKRRRIAARIVLYEVSWLETAYATSLKFKDMGDIAESTALHDAWRSYRESLGDLPWPAWRPVELAVMIADYPPPGYHEDSMTQNREMLKKAEGFLEPFAKGAGS